MKRCLPVGHHLLFSIAWLVHDAFVFYSLERERVATEETRFVLVGTLALLQILSNSIQNQTILQQQPTTQELLPTHNQSKETFIKK